MHEKSQEPDCTTYRKMKALAQLPKDGKCPYYKPKREQVKKLQEMS